MLFLLSLLVVRLCHNEQPPEYCEVIFHSSYFETHYVNIVFSALDFNLVTATNFPQHMDFFFI